MISQDPDDLDARLGESLDPDLFAEQCDKCGERVPREDVMVDLPRVVAEQAIDQSLALGPLWRHPGRALVAPEGRRGNGQVFLNMRPVTLTHRFAHAPGAKPIVLDKVGGRRDGAAAVEAALSTRHGDE